MQLSTNQRILIILVNNCDVNLMQRLLTNLVNECDVNLTYRVLKYRLSSGSNSHLRGCVEMTQMKTRMLQTHLTIRLHENDVNKFSGSEMAGEGNDKTVNYSGHQKI